MAEKKNKPVIKEVRYSFNGEVQEHTVGDSIVVSTRNVKQITSINIEVLGNTITVYIKSGDEVLMSIISPEIELFY